MNSARVKAMALSAALAAVGVVVPTAAATSAQASSCSFNSLAKSDINAWGYIGYEEMQYSPGCRTVRTHLHIDSNFRTGHSGWNVTTYLEGGLGSNGLPQYDVVTTPAPNNTSWSDYYSAEAGIGNYPTEIFTSVVDWQSDGCKLEQATWSHDFSNGNTLSNGIGYIGGCP